MVLALSPGVVPRRQGRKVRGIRLYVYGPVRIESKQIKQSHTTCHPRNLLEDWHTRFRKSMKTQRPFIIMLLLFSGLLLSACGRRQSLSPTFTPMATFAPKPTILPTPTLTPTSPAITVNCIDQANVESGVYRAENNTWGKGTLSGWSQCIGLGLGTDGTLMGRWTWNWLNSGDNVKAYPEIIFGQKPGSVTTSADLPRKISSRWRGGHCLRCLLHTHRKREYGF